MNAYKSVNWAAKNLQHEETVHTAGPNGLVNFSNSFYIESLWGQIKRKLHHIYYMIPCVDYEEFIREAVMRIRMDRSANK